MAEREVRYCTTEDGVRIAYCVEGEGPPLLVMQFFVESFSLDHRLPEQVAFMENCGAGDGLSGTTHVVPGSRSGNLTNTIRTRVRSTSRPLPTPSGDLRLRCSAVARARQWVYPSQFATLIELSA